MRKIFLLMLIILTMSGCGSEKVSKIVDRIEHKETLIVGLDDSFAPMGFRNEFGEIVGFDVDLAKEAARRMNIEFEFKPIDWAKKREEITSGNIDIIWNGCDITDERKEYMIFSKPYMDSRQVLVIKKGNNQFIFSEYDLKGKVVATQAGTSTEAYIDKDIKDSFAAFKICNDMQAGFESLKNGEYDALIVDEIAARYEMTKHPDTFDIVEANVSPVTEFGIGFRKGDEELRDKIQLAFDDMIRDGTAKKISEHWFNADLIKLIKY